MRGSSEHLNWAPGERCRVVSGVLTFAVGLMIWLVAAAAAKAQTEKVIYTFTGATGSQPNAGLVGDWGGNFYGSTFYGGDLSVSCFGTPGCGVVFKLNRTGKQTVLYTFTGGSDGAGPVGNLILDAWGNLYGTSSTGGAFSNGNIFKVTPAGKETVPYSFTGGADGGSPGASLILDAKGDLYGTTEQGGVSGWGTVFKLEPSGKETVLYSFTNGNDGGFPTAGLIWDTVGSLYSTTLTGGAFGSGTVFKLDLSRTDQRGFSSGNVGTETVLYSFSGGSDGARPQGGVIWDAAGNLYGTTSGGGLSGQGTVFKLDRAGKETALYSFTGGEDGGNPFAGLIRDSTGNLYGTTFFGGSGLGVVFRVDLTGKETVLHRFTGGADGGLPVASLIRDFAGNLYGTATEGGDLTSSACAPYGCGVVFKLTPSRTGGY